MMRAKCKNCKHYTWTIEGDAWCSKNICYTNNDGCCSEYKRCRCNIGCQIAVMAIPIVAFVIALIALLMNG